MSTFLHEQDPELSIARKCALLGIGRTTSYRISGQCESTAWETELRDCMHKIALEMSCYGYRTLTRELNRQNFRVGERRVRRLMREDNLLCLRRRRFIATTDSDHDLQVYPNLAKELVPTAPNQLWRSDITYVRLQGEFVYLAVVLDAFSRRVIGWSLQRYLDTRLVMEALTMTLQSREIQPGLVHHSDRGVQDASKQYTEALKAAGIQISMSRKANPYDNAQAESFMKTLKYEEVYLREYDDLRHARECIGHFIEQVYNRKRLHSSIGYVPPVEFEQSLQA